MLTDELVPDLQVDLNLALGTSQDALVIRIAAFFTARWGRAPAECHAGVLSATPFGLLLLILQPRKQHLAEKI